MENLGSSQRKDAGMDDARSGVENIGSLQMIRAGMSYLSDVSR